MQNFTSVILYMNIICNAQWLVGAILEISDYSADLTWRQKRFTYKQESTFKQTRVDFFTAKIWRYFSITSQLR